MVVHIWFVMNCLKIIGQLLLVNCELGLLIAQVCDSRVYFNKTPVT